MGGTGWVLGDVPVCRVSKPVSPDLAETLCLLALSLVLCSVIGGLLTAGSSVSEVG